MAYSCNQCEPECDGATNCVCYACGMPVCKNCSRMLTDRQRKGALSRICLNCASDWPERYGFRSKKDDNTHPKDADYFWAATGPEYRGSVKQVMARKFGTEVALALMDDKDQGPFRYDPFVEPPYREFK